MTRKIRPYMPGHGPVILFNLYPVGNGTYNGSVSDDSGEVRFTFNDYRPSVYTRDDTRAMCGDLASFALAYVERPDEFGREPDDTEQIHAAWWRQHGDAITSALLPDDDE